MQRAWLAVAAFLSFACLSAKGGTWAAIPPEVWQMKATDPGNELGAVFLSCETRLGERDTEYRLRIRVLSEPGKAAAQFATFPADVYKLEGRTVYPDGREVAFDSAKDFASQKISQADAKEERMVVIPPGLTKDCVVDIHWILLESSLGSFDQWGNYQGNRWSDVVVPRAFPVRHAVIQLSNRSPMASVVVGYGSHPPAFEKQSVYRVFTFDDVPAFEDIPYSIPTTRERATLFLYWQLPELVDVSRDKTAYWPYWAKRVLSKWFGSDLRFGRSYRAYLEKIKLGLPEDPSLIAAAVVARIRADILNVDELTEAQAQNRTKEQKKAEPNSSDLELTMSNGWTDTAGINYLAFKVLSDMGLKPHLMFAVDREARGFHRDIPCVFQFSEMFLGIPNASGTGMSWIDPGNLLLPPGVMPSNFQGTTAMEVDPTDWSIRETHVPFQAAAVNQRTFAYQLDIRDGRVTFKEEAGSQGIPMWQQRDRYYKFAPSAQDKVLKETFQDDLKGYEISAAAVHSGQDLAKEIRFSIQGAKDLDEGRKVILDPFPGMPYPYWTPSSWPAARSALIVLPYMLRQAAISRIRIPAGYTVLVDPDLDERNRFGTVSWVSTLTEDGQGKMLTVQYEVEALKAVGGAQEYEAFKAFLGWIQTARDRGITLQKTR